MATVFLFQIPPSFHLQSQVFYSSLPISNNNQNTKLNQILNEDINKDIFISNKIQEMSDNHNNIVESNINEERKNKENVEILEKNIEKNNNEIENKNNNPNYLTDLKIELYPNNIPKDNLDKKSIKTILTQDTLGHSLDINKDLAFLGAKVPLLMGFYTAHNKHYPIRIKPDDIWLLIVQSFSNHVNYNSEQLREYFVDFDGKKKLEVKYHGIFYKENVDKKILEDFSIQINEQMKNYIGEEILQNLTPNFSTTDYNSTIISKLSIMGAFKKYFEFCMFLPECGIPYIILEGTIDDYESIKEKAEKLSKYKFDWYIKRIIPHIQKMIDAKRGNIDIDYFKNIIQKIETTEAIKECGSKSELTIDNITGWILDFFAYIKRNEGKVERFSGESIKVKEIDLLSNQMLVVPFTIYEEITKKTYEMKYSVGFIGCEQNEEKEVFPVQGWIVSPYSKEKEEEKEYIIIDY